MKGFVAGVLVAAVLATASVFLFRFAAIDGSEGYARAPYVHLGEEGEA